MSDKTLSQVSASEQRDAHYHATGAVELRALPDWLKGGKFVTAEMTPEQARDLAVELLLAAKRAERVS